MFRSLSRLFAKQFVVCLASILLISYLCVHLEQLQPVGGGGGGAGGREQVAILTEFNSPLVPPDSPQLLAAVRGLYLHPPPARAAVPYKHKWADTSMGQSGVVDAIYRGKRGGFFVECGALDGSFLSNTLFLEQQRGWTGLLVEPDPKKYAKLANFGRRSYSSQSCLATKAYPHKAYFTSSGLTGHIITDDSDFSSTNEINVIPEHILTTQCLPLYTLLLAVNRTTVDYFSLDIEGLELEVLHTIPWKLLDIKVLSVEFQHMKPAEKMRLRHYMEAQDYMVVTEVIAGLSANDFIFIKTSLASALEGLDLEEAKKLPYWVHMHIKERKLSQSKYHKIPRLEIVPI